MIFKKLHIITGVSVSMLLASCGEFQRVLRSEDVSEKYEFAQKIYEKQKYKQSERLFAAISNEYLGKPQGERILYMLGDSYYQQKYYLLAAHTFEKLALNYPKSQKVEEALLLEAKSYFQETPKYSIEQENTYKAIEKLQAFIDRYPNSSQLGEANQMMQKLITQLQKKSFEIAKGYNKIKDYQAALKALDNFLIENPGSIFKEEALYYKLHSAFELASNSVKSKEKKRFEDAKQVYETLIKSFPETQYKAKATKMFSQIEEKLNQL